VVFDGVFMVMIFLWFFVVVFDDVLWCLSVFGGV